MKEEGEIRGLRRQFEGEVEAGKVRLKPERSDFRLERANLRPEMADLKHERVDSGSKMADFGSEWADLGFERGRLGLRKPGGIDGWRLISCIRCVAT